MAETLFPVIETVKNQAVKRYDRTYRKSYQWDYRAGDFARDGANRILQCDGADAYKTWCIKAVMTERKTCLAYPDTVGAEMMAAFQKPSQKAQESAIERTIRETLLANPRTESVQDFSFTWKSDSVMVAFTVKGINQDSFRMEV